MYEIDINPDQPFSIEIGHEAHEEGLMLKGEHRILPLGWADYLNREFNRWDLFSYYHILSKNFVLCQWLDKKMGVCKELETSPKKFENGGWKHYDFMRARLRPQEEVFAEMQRKILNKQTLEQQDKVKGYERKKDAIKYLKRKGMDETAYHLKSANFAGETGEITDNLIEASKSKGRLYFT